MNDFGKTPSLAIELHNPHKAYILPIKLVATTANNAIQNKTTPNMPI